MESSKYTSNRVAKEHHSLQPWYPYPYMVANPPVTAILGDIVRSKRMEPTKRNDTQAILEGLLAEMNRRYERSILGDFLLTLGDEFQGLLDDPSVVPDIVQDIREELPKVRFRIVASRGQLTTEIKPNRVALGTDGPAWHEARRVLEQWRAAKRDGVAFVGFGDDDTVLNGLSGLLTHHWSHLEASQREIIDALRHHEGLRKEAAADMSISQQALSNRAQTAGWREYEGGIIACRALLQRHAPRAAPLHVAEGKASPSRIIR
jgi:SatD family (SatD)